MLDRGTAQPFGRRRSPSIFDSIGGAGVDRGRPVRRPRQRHGRCARIFRRRRPCWPSVSRGRPFPPASSPTVQQLALGDDRPPGGRSARGNWRTVLRQLPAGSPYHIMPGGKRKTVEKLTVKDLKQYHARYFVPNNMVVTVFGDLDAGGSARTWCGSYFGGLKPASDFRPLSFDRPTPSAETIVRHKAIGKRHGDGLLRLSDGQHFRQERLSAAMTLVESGHVGLRHCPGGWLSTSCAARGWSMRSMPRK